MGSGIGNGGQFKGFKAGLGADKDWPSAAGKGKIGTCTDLAH